MTQPPHKSTIEKINAVATLGRVIDPILSTRGVKQTEEMTQSWFKEVLARTEGANHMHL